jgi:hypothetical protein
MKMKMVGHVAHMAEMSNLYAVGFWLKTSKGREIGKLHKAVW